MRLYRKTQALKDHQNLEILFHKYLENQCTPEETETILTWLMVEEYSQEQKDLISRLLSGHPEISKPLTKVLQQRLQKNLEDTLQKIEENEKAGNKLKKLPWLRFAAAVLLIIAGSGIYLLLQYKAPSRPAATAINKEQTKPTNTDLAPGGNKAVLTLGDGTAIVLDDAKNGTLTQQGNTKVIKFNGKLTYDPANPKDGEILYNTISTPRGGQY